MISDKALDAAARVVYATCEDEPELPENYDGEPDVVKDHYRSLAQPILEAAAPYMQGEAELQWGVRDTDPRCSSVVAVHPSEESARAIVAEHPAWYELVSRERPEAEPQWTMTP